jgi:hypothetical protein
MLAPAQWGRCCTRASLLRALAENDSNFAGLWHRACTAGWGSGPRGLKGAELKAAVGKFVEQMKPHLAAAERHGVALGIENHGNNPANTTFPTRYEIDYVRIYQEK